MSFAFNFVFDSGTGTELAAFGPTPLVGGIRFHKDATIDKISIFADVNRTAGSIEIHLKKNFVAQNGANQVVSIDATNINKDTNDNIDPAITVVDGDIIEAEAVFTAFTPDTSDLVGVFEGDYD